ncbi:Uncharacterized protein APZ42_007567 [Daphnia magna]|uniref:Uncharacterized protein n=1 Tax=Daphnia magna TaxID=35525 RepID=A0A164F7R3_9CRUS|nr:Uncharacterized protein APZ42_007567 [Daphnia magna]
MQKGTVSQRCWNAVNGTNQNTMNWWLFEGYKRKRSLKSVGTQSVEQLRTKCSGGCLRGAK